jgi:hypothetical protein
MTLYILLIFNNVLDIQSYIRYFVIIKLLPLSGHSQLIQ